MLPIPKHVVNPMGNHHFNILGYHKANHSGRHATSIQLKSSLLVIVPMHIYLFIYVDCIMYIRVQRIPFHPPQPPSCRLLPVRCTIYTICHHLQTPPQIKQPVGQRHVWLTSIWINHHNPNHLRYILLWHHVCW